jgi:mRNA interferase MazF
MVARRPAPDRGALVWLDFDPTRGHEQRGRRPALVVSPKAYNAKSGLALVCPITTQAKEYPFEVPFATKSVQGVILADQIRGVDWKERHAETAGTVSDFVLAEVQEHIRKLIAE